MTRKTTDPVSQSDLPVGRPADEEAEVLRSLRLRQQREAARGCLLALVLEGAALLAGVLWAVSAVLDMPRLSTTAAFGFYAFTLAAAGVGVLLIIQGNLPRQRRLRRAAAEAARHEAHSGAEAVAPPGEIR